MQVRAKDPVTQETKLINNELVLNSDEEYCAVHLINRGCSIEDKEITVEFSKTGYPNGFLCSVNGKEFKCKFMQSLLCDFTWTVPHKCHFSIISLLNMNIALNSILCPGSSPLVLRDLDAGQYVIQIVPEGCSDYSEWKKAIMIP